MVVAEVIVVIYVILVAAFLIMIGLISIVNALSLLRLSSPARPIREFPLISVLNTVRDEAAVITKVVMKRSEIRYTNLELIFLDDNSSDGTGLLIQNAIEGDARFSILEGASLPAGWKGKNWACHQLSQHAHGEILLFTDADVIWELDTLSSVCVEFSTSKADLLTVWPTQTTCSWAERLVVPLMGLTIIGYLPALAVHHLPWPIFSAAMGQCLAFRREAYFSIGGHRSVREALVEDMAFAYAIKHKGMNLRTADGASLIFTRMYHGWADVRDGFAKNIIGGHGDSLFLLLVSTLFHLSIFIFSWIWLFIQPIQALVPCGLGLLIRLLTAAVTRQRLLDAFLMPASVLLMTIIAGRAMQWRFTGGQRWIGRAYGR